MAILFTTYKPSGTLLQLSSGAPHNTRPIFTFDSLFTRSFYDSEDLGAKVLFLMDHQAWTTDGTTAGTQTFTDIRAAYFDAAVTKHGNVMAMGTGIYLYPEVGPQELLLDDRYARDVIQVGKNALFRGFPAHPQNPYAAIEKLYLTDGTTSGTVLFEMYSQSGDPQWNLAEATFSEENVFGDMFLFTARSDADVDFPGRSIWLSDGTVEGTTRLDGAGQHLVSFSDSHVGTFEKSGGRVYFVQEGYDANGDHVFTFRSVNLKNRSEKMVVDFSANDGTPLNSGYRKVDGVSNSMADGKEGFYFVLDVDEVVSPNGGGFVRSAFEQIVYYNRSTKILEDTSIVIGATFMGSVDEHRFLNNRIVGWDSDDRKLVAVKVKDGTAQDIGIDAPFGLWDEEQFRWVGDNLLAFVSVHSTWYNGVDVYALDGRASGSRYLGQIKATVDLDAQVVIDGDTAYVADSLGGGNADIIAYDSVTGKTKDLGPGMLLGTVEDSLLLDTTNGLKVAGTRGDDVIFGSAGKDILKGRKGVDDIQGGAGNDILKGGTGRDTVKGGKGADKIQGGAGNDILEGGAGKDIVKVGKGGGYAGRRCRERPFDRWGRLGSVPVHCKSWQ
ncbi:calcium-binding protein [Phaeobacter sp. 22II1-1F12B]|uniref:calcium-binding protein n=1 Tax=Phaeobacter sp. 22II1-1F12B TaxID=1317111 RepID=UPI000B51F4EA|nr:calcium-binding protein [Phaeobacter sp. 22II1-1F12B]